MPSRFSASQIFPGSVDAEVVLVHPADRGFELLIADRPGGQCPADCVVAGGRGDRAAVLGQHAADRLDPEPFLVLADEPQECDCGRPGSAEESRGRLEDLIRPAQLPDLGAKLAQLSGFFAAHPRPPAVIDFGLEDPFTQRFRAADAHATLLPPCAQASTIRPRNARPCAVLRRLTQFSNVLRSSPVSTSGSSLLSAIPPAQLTHQPGDRPGPELGHKATHVVARELKAGSLACLARLV